MSSQAGVILLVPGRCPLCDAAVRHQGVAWLDALGLHFARDCEAVDLAHGR